MMAMERLIEDAEAVEWGATASLQIDLLKEWVADRATTALPEARDRSRSPNAAAGTWRWLAMGIGGAVATALVAVVLLRVPEHDADGWQSRGSRKDPFAIKVFCEVMTPSGRPSLAIVSKTPLSTDVDRCSEARNLRFAYLSDGPGYLYVFMRTRTHAGDRLLKAVLGTPLALTGTATLKALPLQLPKDYAAGEAEISLVFVRSPARLPIDTVREDVTDATTTSFVVLNRTIRLGTR